MAKAISKGEAKPEAQAEFQELQSEVHKPAVSLAAVSVLL